jgi:hypothetical protein
MPPASSLMFTPASSLAIGSSRAVTSRDQPPSYTRLLARENGYLNVGMLPVSESGGTLESGLAASSAGFVERGTLIVLFVPVLISETLSVADILLFTSFESTERLRRRPQPPPEVSI